MKYLVSFFLVFCLGVSWTQLTIHGKVQDFSTLKPISGAIVVASKVKDSMLVKFTRTNIAGEFSLFNLPIDTFKITIGHPNFQDQFIYVFGNENEKLITLPAFQLDNTKKELAPAFIYVNKSPIYYKGDTLVFVADSFKVRENGVVEDLLRKLPGVSVDARGKVTFQGKDIDQIYVDGDEFFGNDPTVATKNLGAKAIQNVQIYEKKNNTENGEEAKQIMNLKLKDDAKKGYFGKTSIATDGQKFYEAELLFNRYQNKKNYSFYVLKNNTPRAGFNWQDQNKYGLNSNVNYSNSGFPDNFTSGARFKNSYGNDNNHFFEINYQYRDTKAHTITTNNTQYLIADTSYYTANEQNEHARLQKHTLNIENKWKLDSLTSIELIPKVDYFIKRSENNNSTNFLTNHRTLFRSTENNISDSTSEIVLSNTLKLEKKYRNPKRESSISSDLEYSDNTDLGEVIFSNQLANLIKLTKQQNNITQKTINQTLTVFHTEPLTNRINLNVEFMNNTTTDQQVREISDIQNLLQIPNSKLSSDYARATIINRAKISLTRKLGAHIMIVGGALRNLSLSSTNNLTSTTFSLNNNQYLPYASYTFNQKNAIRINLAYSTSSPIPNINQLQPVLSNINLNYQTIGNPNLKPAFKQTTSISVSRFNNLLSRYFFLRANADFIDNDFANSLTYDSSGRAISKTVNVNGNQNYSLSCNYKHGIPKRSMFLTGGLDFTHSLAKSIINGLQYSTLQTSITPNLGLSYSTDTLTISLNGSMGYNKPAGNSLLVKQNPYFDYNNSLDISWNVPKFNFLLTTSVNQQITTGRTNGFNINRTIWNATVSKYVLKNKRLNIGVEAYDILNQNLQIQRKITSNQISDSRTLIITRYFLMRLSYRFDPTNISQNDYKKIPPFGPGMPRPPRNEKY